MNSSIGWAGITGSSLSEGAKTRSSQSVEAATGGGEAPEEISLLSVTTLVLWLGCAGVGLSGFLFPYPKKAAPPAPALPLQAEVLQVELTQDPIALVEEGGSPPPPAQGLSEPPPPPEIAVPAAAPALIPVAEPSPMVAFAIPVKEPSRVVEPAQAAYAARNEPAIETPAPPVPIQTLAFGRGEGRQPAPEYPPRAIREGQEGTVVVRFSVGANGRVLAAEAISPSPWPLLNEAAVRVVRERWRFRPGAVRLFEVPIHFQLTK